jgi:hypothetical protein
MVKRFSGSKSVNDEMAEMFAEMKLETAGTAEMFSGGPRESFYEADV